MGRRLNLLGFAVCVALLGYAWYAQAVLHLEPCPLCIFQRVGIGVTGVLFLLAAAHPAGRLGARVYGALIALSALVTIGVASRHLWIEAQPPGTVPTCGATLSYLLQVFPLTDVIRKVLTGSGECARVTWRFLGLTMPAWVLIAAVALAALGLYANWTRARARA